MKHIWSPWRMDYIEKPKQEDQCVFCEALAQRDGPENLILFRGQHSFVILNRYPYTSGHLMIVPFLHQDALEELGPDARAEVMELISLGTRALEQAYQPQGYNIGLNLGQAAGAGIEDHLHVHVVPRWFGDTNFMSSLGEVRVLPEALDDTYLRVKKAWDAAAL
ncbi:MAG: HIT domain-containing protein [Anaerolineales bacterium]|nr:HIT domain-containing protein [Anaerolineales bacterium]